MTLKILAIHKEYLRETWQRLGVGHDGYLSLEELATVCHAIGMEKVANEVSLPLFSMSPVVFLLFFPVCVVIIYCYDFIIFIRKFTSESKFMSSIRVSGNGTSVFYNMVLNIPSLQCQVFVPSPTTHHHIPRLQTVIF